MFFLLPPNTNSEEDEKTEKKLNPFSEKIPLPNGSWYMQCSKCIKQSQWSEPNQEDGTFVCYACRNDIGL